MLREMMKVRTLFLLMQRHVFFHHKKLVIRSKARQLLALQHHHFLASCSISRGLALKGIHNFRGCSPVVSHYPDSYGGTGWMA